MQERIKDKEKTLETQQKELIRANTTTSKLKKELELLTKKYNNIKQQSTTKSKEVC